LTAVAAPQCSPACGVRCGYHRWMWCSTSHDRAYLQPKIVHVEVRVGFATLGQSVFFVPTAHDRIRTNFLQDRRYASAVGIQLDRWPRIGFRSAHVTSVLRLDPDE